MIKISRIILLINLLYNRPYVSIKTMINTCGISRRTIFRYINQISDANIPIYFDKKVKAYRLNNNHNRCIDKLGIQDEILILTGLKLLSSNLNDDYKSHIESLIQKYHTRLTYPLEDLWKQFEYQLEKIDKNCNISELLTSILIHTAIKTGKKAELSTFSVNNLSKSLLSITNLKFDGNWRIIANNDNSMQEYSIDDILSITIK